MKIDATVGGPARRKDPRDLRNWVGSMKLKATQEGEQFLLAAIYHALRGQGSNRLRDALTAEAKTLLKQHLECERKTGVKCRIT